MAKRSNFWRLRSLFEPKSVKRRYRPYLEVLEDRSIPAVAGSLDAFFGVGGAAYAQLGSSAASAYGIYRDDVGRIYSVGNTADGNFGLVRYRPNGTLDTSFDPVENDGQITGGQPGENAGVAVATFGTAGNADYRVVVVVNHQQGAQSEASVYRFNENGSIDTTFGVGGRADIDTGAALEQASRVFVDQTNGSILVVGSVGQGSTSSFLLARLDNTGAFDATFGASGIVVETIDTRSEIRGLAVDGTGNIFVAGTTQQGVGVPTDFIIAKYKPGGTLDSLFGSGGIVRLNVSSSSGDDVATSIAIGPGGNLYVGGYGSLSSQSFVAIASFRADGALNTAFGAGNGFVLALPGNQLDNFLNDLTIDASNRLVAVGASQAFIVSDTRYDAFVARYDLSGAADTTFGTNGFARFPISASAGVGGGNGEYGNAVVVAGNEIYVAGEGPVHDQDYGFLLFKVSGTTSGPVAGLTAADDFYSIAIDQVLDLDLAGLLGPLANDGPFGDRVVLAAQTSTVSAFEGTLTYFNERGTFVFTPANGFNGLATFTYELTDGATTSNEATIRIQVGPPNTPPVAVDDNLGVLFAEGGSFSFGATEQALITSNDIDPDAGAILSIGNVGNPVGGTVFISGSIIFIADTDFFGEASFEYTVSDGQGGSDVGIVTFTISEINDPPQAGNDDLSTSLVTEDTPYTFANLLANDNAGPGETTQTLTITGISNVTGGTAVIVGNTVVFTPFQDYFGPASFEYTITDNGTTNGAPAPLTDTALVTFGVFNVNDPPIAGPDTLADVAEDSGPGSPFSSFILLDNDNAGPGGEFSDSLTVTAVTAGVGGSVTLVSGLITFTPAPDFFGVASFTYTLTDDAGESSFGTVTLNVTPVNDDPVGVDDSLLGTLEDTPVFVIPFSALTGNDSKGPANESSQTLTITNLSGVFGGTAVIVGNTIEFTPDPDFNGPAGFTYAFTDDGVTGSSPDPKTGVANVTFPVRPVNDPPIAFDLFVGFGDEDLPVVIPIANFFGGFSPGGGTDELSQTVTLVAIGNLPGGGGKVVSDGVNITFTPDPNFNGFASFSFTIQDNGFTDGVSNPRTATAVASLFIYRSNDPPIPTTDFLSDVPEDSGPRIISLPPLLENDAPGPLDEVEDQSLILLGIQGVFGGTAVLDGDTVIFTPTPNYNGPAGFYYVVQDQFMSEGEGEFETALGLVQFNVTEVNDPITVFGAVLANHNAADGALFVPWSTLLAGAIPGPDNELGQQILGAGAFNVFGGTIAFVSSGIVFTPTPGYSGTAGFTYLASDDGTTNGVSDPQFGAGQVTFQVTAAPVTTTPTPTTPGLPPAAVSPGTTTASIVTSIPSSYTVTTIAPYESYVETAGLYTSSDGFQELNQSMRVLLGPLPGNGRTANLPYFDLDSRMAGAASLFQTVTDFRPAGATLVPPDANILSPEAPRRGRILQIVTSQFDGEDNVWIIEGLLRNSRSPRSGTSPSQSPGVPAPPAPPPPGDGNISHEESEPQTTTQTSWSPAVREVGLGLVLFMGFVANLAFGQLTGQDVIPASKRKPRKNKP